MPLAFGTGALLANLFSPLVHRATKDLGCGFGALISLGDTARVRLGEEGRASPEALGLFDWEASASGLAPRACSTARGVDCLSTGECDGECGGETPGIWYTF